MRFVYADPPYLGYCRYYDHRHEDWGCWDDPETHRALIDHLLDFDGYALSMSAPSLQTILPMIPAGAARICPWVKPFASFKRNVTQAYAWEPIIVRPARVRPVEEPTVRDWVSAPITLRRGFTGAKPEAVMRWLFDFAGLERDDEFVDLFPGSGAVTEAWTRWRAQAPLGLVG